MDSTIAFVFISFADYPKNRFWLVKTTFHAWESVSKSEFPTQFHRIQSIYMPNDKNRATVDIIHHRFTNAFTFAFAFDGTNLPDVTYVIAKRTSTAVQLPKKNGFILIFT